MGRSSYGRTNRCAPGPGASRNASWHGRPKRPTASGWPNGDPIAPGARPPMPKAPRRFARSDRRSLTRGLSPERPVLILSGNSTAHALMALGAQHVGVPSAALAPAYSLTGGDYLKLRDIARQLTPGLIFADDAAKYAAAVSAVFPADVPVVALTGDIPDRETIPFDVLAATPSSPEMEAALRRCRARHRRQVPLHLGHHRLAQGGDPDPADALRQPGDGRRLLRLPARRAARGRRLGAVEPHRQRQQGLQHGIYNGGTYYIDAGKPTPDHIGRPPSRTCARSRPTWYFNVPVGYQMLLDAMETDDRLRDLLRAGAMLMYAGAGMSQPVWDRITRAAEEIVPGGVLLCHRPRLDRDRALRADVHGAAGDGRQPRHPGTWVTN
jgi:feruloyl-CoA synthase